MGTRRDVAAMFSAATGCVRAVAVLCAFAAATVRGEGSYELAEGNLKLGFSAAGAALASVNVGGVDCSHGAPSFRDRIIHETKPGVEMMEDLGKCSFRQEERNEKDGRKWIVFAFDSQAFPGLTYRKRYELRVQDGSRVLHVTLRVSNGSTNDISLVHSAQLMLRIGEGVNRLLMPDASGGLKRFDYPGSGVTQMSEIRPKQCGFGLMDEKGAGFVFYAPPRRTGGFYSWMSQNGVPIVTEEYWGVNETLKAGGTLTYGMRLVVTPDVEGHLAAHPVKMGALFGAPAMHLEKFASPPKQVVTITVGGDKVKAATPRERLVKQFRIPVDHLQQVHIADVGYHEAWFKPSDSVDILYVYNPGTAFISNGKRLMSDLAARMDLTFHTVPMILEVMGTRSGKPYSVYPTYLGDKVDPWSVELLRAAAARTPKVVLVQNHDFKFIQQEVQDILAGFAKKGAGLVFVDCQNVPETLCGKKRFYDLESRTMSIPKMCDRRVTFVKVCEPPAGGRFSILVNAQRPLLNPSVPESALALGRNSLVHGREFPFDDYLHLATVKAIRLAAGVEGAASFETARADRLRVRVKTACAMTLRMTFKDLHRFVDGEATRPLALKEGLNNVAFVPPALPGGVHICEMRLVDAEGKVQDAAAFRFETPDPHPLSLTFAQPDRIYGAAAPVAFKVAVGGGAPEGARLVAELEDSDFRVIRRETRPVSDEASFAFPQAFDPMLLERVIVSLVAADGKVLSKAVEEVSVRMRPRDLSDTSAYITIRATAAVMPLLRELGFDFVINPFGAAPESIRQTANLGITSIPRGCAASEKWFRPYRGDNPNGNPVRQPCFSSEDYRKELHERIGKVGANMRYDFYNVRYHWLGDECFLGSTVCYSPSCLAEFRQALEAKYGDIAKLNARWGASYASFADVTPCQLREITDKGNLARWLEHKMFMSRQFAEKWVGGTKKELNAVSPGSFTGPTGTAIPGYGWDWSQMMKHIDAVGYYCGAQRKLVHDFAELYGHSILAGQCGGGYTHAQFDYEPYNYDVMWSGLLKGSNLAYHYYGAAIDGDFTATSNMQYWAASLAELKGGIGKMWLSGRYRSKVSVLYSQPSLFVAKALVGDVKWQNALTSWWRILSELKIDFRFLPYEALAKGVPEGVKVLVLPEALALSDAERASIARFVAGGGKVLADDAPGAYDEAGVKTGRDVPGVDCLGGDVADYCAVAVGAAGETASVTGAGAEKAKALRARVGRALAAVGVVPEVSVVGADGNEYACDAPIRRDGDTMLFAMHVDTFGSSNDGSVNNVKGTDIGRFDLAHGDRVVAHLPEKGHVYDVRARTYIGFTDEIATTLVPGYTRMYSILKAKPAPVTVECPGAVKAGEALRFSFAAADAVGPQVFNVRIVDPSGKAPWRFRKNVRSVNGRGACVFETAFNDARGVWRAVVTHVNTGSSREARFTVE